MYSALDLPSASQDLFVSMKDYFYVSLCDEELCEGAAGIFDALFA
eukprot:SAG11_NODE_27229_length_335_cov_0.661017_1_plen_44_part_10